MLTFFRFFVKMNDTDRNVMSFNSHTFDPKGSFHNKSEMVGVSAWCHIGDKTLHGWVLMHDQKCRLHSLGQNICGAHAKSLSLAWNKLRLCSTNHRRGCFGNLACDLLSIVWTYSEQDTENGSCTDVTCIAQNVLGQFWFSCLQLIVLWF